MVEENSAQHIQTKGKAIKVIPIEDQNVYVADVMLPNGEIAYFASELIFNDDRKEKWQTYRKATLPLVEHRGILRDGIILAKTQGIEWFHSQPTTLNFFLLIALI